MAVFFRVALAVVIRRGVPPWLPFDRLDGFFGQSVQLSSVLDDVAQDHEVVFILVYDGRTVLVSVAFHLVRGHLFAEVGVC
jgi:hypothetical protein